MMKERLPVNVYCDQVGTVPRYLLQWHGLALKPITVRLHYEAVVCCHAIVVFLRVFALVRLNGRLAFCISVQNLPQTCGTANEYLHFFLSRVEVRFRPCSIDKINLLGTSLAEWLWAYRDLWLQRFAHWFFGLVRSRLSKTHHFPTLAVSEPVWLKAIRRLHLKK